MKIAIIYEPASSDGYGVKGDCKYFLDKTVADTTVNGSGTGADPWGP